MSGEFIDKVGREIEAQEKTFAVWMFMDKGTMARAEKKELVEGKTPFSEVCDFLEILTHEGENRKAIAEYAKLQAPVRMDLSAIHAKEAAAAASPEAPEPGCPLCRRFTPGCLRQSPKVFKCEGEGHRQADCPSRPGVEIQCNKCGGWGHYAALSSMRVPPRASSIVR